MDFCLFEDSSIFNLEYPRQGKFRSNQTTSAMFPGGCYISTMSSPSRYLGHHDGVAGAFFVKHLSQRCTQRFLGAIRGKFPRIQIAPKQGGTNELVTQSKLVAQARSKARYGQWTKRKPWQFLAEETPQVNYIAPALSVYICLSQLMQFQPGSTTGICSTAVIDQSSMLRQSLDYLLDEVSRTRMYDCMRKSSR